MIAEFFLDQDEIRRAVHLLLESRFGSQFTVTDVNEGTDYAEDFHVVSIEFPDSKADKEANVAR